MLYYLEDKKQKDGKSTSKMIHAVFDLSIPNVDYFLTVSLLKEIDRYLDWAPQPLGYGLSRSAVLEKPRFHSAIGYFALTVPFIAVRDILASVTVYHSWKKEKVTSSSKKSNKNIKGRTNK